MPELKLLYGTKLSEECISKLFLKLDVNYLNTLFSVEEFNKKFVDIQLHISNYEVGVNHDFYLKYMTFYLSINNNTVLFDSESEIELTNEYISKIFLIDVPDEYKKCFELMEINYIKPKIIFCTN